MSKVKPKKHLGQHFLNDKNIAKKIVDGLSVKENKNVLEIGPGMGVLTEFLVQNTSLNLKVIEIDRESVAYLKENLIKDEEQIIEGDFLKLQVLKDYDQVSIIGNFPYNISSQIFFKVLENRDKVDEVVCMIQKEVADRIRAPHGSKTYGILSVLLQTFYDIDYLFTVHENVFIPPPKVKSGVIRLRRNSKKELGCDEKLYFQVVKATFNQRRKTIRNSVKNLIKEVDFESNYLHLRPEQLSVEDFISLTKELE